MLRHTLVAVLLVSTLSAPVSASSIFKKDPVFNKVWTIGIGVLTVVVGTGIGVLFGTMVGPRRDMSCCAWQKQCESNPAAIITSVTTTCTGGNCASCLTQYEACCAAANDASNKAIIISALVGAAIGLAGYAGVLLLNRVCRTPDPEKGPLIV